MNHALHVWFTWRKTIEEASESLKGKKNNYSNFNKINHHLVGPHFSILISSVSSFIFRPKQKKKKDRQTKYKYTPWCMCVNTSSSIIMRCSIHFCLWKYKDKEKSFPKIQRSVFSFLIYLFFSKYIYIQYGSQWDHFFIKIAHKFSRELANIECSKSGSHKALLVISCHVFGSFILVYLQAASSYPPWNLYSVFINYSKKLSLIVLLQRYYQTCI